MLQLRIQCNELFVIMFDEDSVPLRQRNKISDSVVWLSVSVGLDHTDSHYLTAMSKLGPHQLQHRGNFRPRENLTGPLFNYSQQYHRSSGNRNPQSAYWRNMTEEKRALEREKSRLRMQASRARKKERERLLTERKKQTFQQCS